MSKKQSKSLFWISYSDLMTSLFFVMLVLFCISMVKLKGALADANVTIEQQRQILKIEEQFHELSKSSGLVYLEENKIFTAKTLLGKDIFKPNSDSIRNDMLCAVTSVGHSLDTILRKLNEQNPDLSFLLVIEGTAAIPIESLLDNSYNPDNVFAYRLSFNRAMKLYNTWRENDINLRKYNTEILICGSGFNGINRDKINEDNNKRFFIQIIPKISRPESLSGKSFE